MMVKNGVDRIGEYKSLFSQGRLGLITSVSGVDRQLNPTIRHLESYHLTALFAPEHGIRGDAAAGDVYKRQVYQPGQDQSVQPEI